MVGKIHRKCLGSKASLEDEYYKLPQRRKHILEGLAKGELDIQEGRTFTHAEAQEKLNKWFG